MFSHGSESENNVIKIFKAYQVLKKDRCSCVYRRVAENAENWKKYLQICASIPEIGSFFTHTASDQVYFESRTDCHPRFQVGRKSSWIFTGQWLPKCFRKFCFLER